MTTTEPSTASSGGSIRGRVLMPDGSPVTKPMRVTVSVLRGEQANIYTDSQGNFEVTSLSPGVYTVECEDDMDRKFEPGKERVEVFRNSPSVVTLYMKEKGVAVSERATTKVVSSAEFDQKVPADALREFDRGTKAGKEGKLVEAVEHLRKAVSLYPDYLKARNDLGTYLLAEGRLEEATEEFRKAAQIDAKAFNPQLNLGIVLVERHEFAEAASVLEKAISLDADSPAAHLYAGVAYAALDQSERAEREWTAAYQLGGSKYALAQFHLGQLYMNKGERALALKAFETYLRDAPDAANAGEVRRLIGILR